MTGAPVKRSTWRGARSTRGRNRGRISFTRGSYASRQALVKIAKETKQVLPSILRELPEIRADESELLSLENVRPLQREDCPKHPKAIIRVLNQDTFNAGIILNDMANMTSNVTSSTSSTGNKNNPPSSRPAVLNLASNVRPGGGWETGAMAQEEALCYRSSLSLSLHKRYYPWKAREGLYTRDVVIIRGSAADDHVLLRPAVAAADLPVLSVLSVAAVRDPKLAEGQSTSGDRRQVFAKDADRILTKDKMRLTLRMAATKGHDCLVLGALGCGAYKNPPEEIADAWKEVLSENEFAGGWWREIWFAVLDKSNEGNFEVFEKVLAGLKV